MPRCSRVAIAWIALLCAVPLVGCVGIKGTWELEATRPPEIQDELDIDTLTFRDDGALRVEFESQDEPVEGKYTYDDESGKLTISVQFPPLELRGRARFTDLGWYMRFVIERGDREPYTLEFERE